MSFPKLNAGLLRSGHAFPKDVAVTAPNTHPERILQFGEGNFLRAFVDWMVHRMNTKGLFSGRAVLVQPIPQGMADLINAQDGLYTVILRGIQKGQVVEEKEIVTSVSRCLSPYAQYEAYMACAANPDLRFIVSNTTEAGIKFEAADKLEDKPPASYPGKLTQFLHARFQHFKGDAARGLVMMPCELIERNGDNLKRTVHETAAHWKLSSDFTRWLDEACVFTNTLVDRIVTGYPKDELGELTPKLGYEDSCLDTGEYFHFWVIESPKPIEKELPLKEAGLDVVWTTDMSPYRERKVRILNGAHTMTVLAAYLAGKETVKECMEDELIRTYMERGIQDEILPTLALPKDELQAFASAVTERFSNPFIKHFLLSIALNSVSKYKARILATVTDYHKLKGQLPPRLTFALAALFAFYRGREVVDGALRGDRHGQSYKIQDDAAALEAFRAAWAEEPAAGGSREFCTELTGRILKRADLWGQDLTTALPGFPAAVAESLFLIRTEGVRAAMERVARA